MKTKLIILSLVPFAFCLRATAQSCSIDWSTIDGGGGGTSWGILSDRNAKKNFTPVDSQAVLEKLARVPITRWNYQWEDDAASPHLGPVAQDFKAAFYPGSDDKSITTQEADGVELAAIEGLNQKLAETQQAVKAKDGEIQTLKQQNDSLAERLNELEAAVKALAEKK